MGVRGLLLAIAAAIATAGGAHAQPVEAAVERVEPPFWWTGFEDASLQLLIHGDDVAALEPSVAGDGVTLAGVAREDNPNYLFLQLDVAGAAPGTFDIVLSRGGAVAATIPYELKERAAGSAAREGFAPSDLVYLVTPDRYANGDPSNDVVDGMADASLDRTDGEARHGGDLQGLRDRLAYMADLGVTALWLNPVLENDQARTSYHGYAVTDLFKIDPRYGTNDDYRALAAEARTRGIKLIQDMIPNHIGSENFLAKDPPSDSWFNFDNTYAPSNHLRTTQQDVYAAEIDKAAFADGWFATVMPDLNQREPLLATHLIQNALWWIETADLAGVRIDTYAYSDLGFLGQWMDRVLLEYPNLNVVGEEWSYVPAVVANWQRGTGSPAGAPRAPSMMDFPLYEARRLALTEDDAWGAGWFRLYEFMAQDRLYPDPNGLMTILDNHDMDRVHRQLGRDADLTKLAVAHLMTMRGIPQILYGTEILMANEKPGDHGDIRSDFPGGWPGDAVDAFTGAGLSPEAAEFQAWFRALATWRKTASAVHDGRLVHFAPMDHTDGDADRWRVYVYFRIDEDQTVMVALNKADHAVALEMDRYAEVLNGHETATDVITGETFTLADGVTVPARAALVLEVE